MTTIDNIGVFQGEQIVRVPSGAFPWDSGAVIGANCWPTSWQPSALLGRPTIDEILDKAKERIAAIDRQLAAVDALRVERDRLQKILDAAG